MARTGDGPKSQNDSISEASSGIDSDESSRESVEVSSNRTRLQPKVNRESHTSMYQAAIKGNWQDAEIIRWRDPDVVRARITEIGETALHVAAAMKHTKLVRKLVEWMTQDDLLLKNEFDQTAFCYAAASGIVDIASVMKEKNGSLITQCNKNKLTPLYIAARLGNRDMVLYLYQFTDVKHLEMGQWLDILQAAVRNKMYDVALMILRDNVSLARITHPVTTENGTNSMTENKVTAKERTTTLHLLAGQDVTGITARQEAVFERLVTMFAKIPCPSWLRRIFEEPLVRNRARILTKMLWAEIRRSGQIDATDAYELVNQRPILHEAAKVGNVGFIIMLARSDPDLLFKSNNKERNIFHIAVRHRQENVFCLIHQIGIRKDLMAMSQDNDGNNILHLAGKLAPSSRRKIVSGAALQLQRELLWFKEVEKIVPRECLEMKNYQEKLRPRELFSRKHRRMLKEGEEWMKKTADSCMLMATLIATVVFAAAFTVPGGNNDATGRPTFLNKSWFTVFVVSDAVAMFSSTFSIIMFLSILTSRYQEDDFLVSLPRKLFLGLTALFVAIVSTMVAFTSTFFLLFTRDEEWAARWIAGISCVSLVAVFVALYFKLWIDTIKSTFMSKFMFRPGKHSLY